MKNMQPTKVPMREAEPKVRAKNFGEVALGYTEEEAILEARRCLNCKNRPCIEGCPVSVRIPEFIERITEGDFAAAYRIIRATNALPAVCGRVCPQERQCESRCVRGIKGEAVAIGRLERFVADWAREKGIEPDAPVVCEGEKKRVAVVGSGPSGLSCAGELAARGYAVTVFEAFHTSGGVLVYGIPEFRLPKSIVAAEIESLARAGVEFRTNAVIGRLFTVDDLLDSGFSAVFIGSGAGLPRFMSIPGEDLCGVYSANEYLTRINLMGAYKSDAKTPIRRGKRIAVVGGGNVAMDAARCALRMGAEEVSVIYRRSMDEMPARREEIHHAIEEGVVFRTLCNPTAILGDDGYNVRAIRCIEMELGEPDASGRRAPIEKAGSEFELDVDLVIIAVGTSPNPLIKSTTPGLESDRRGCIVTREDGVTTTKEGVWAGGDAVTGAATVILAMGAGRRAAEKIDESIRGLH